MGFRWRGIIFVCILLSVDCYFNCPQIHWLPEEEHMVFGSLDSQSHITVKLYTKPCAEETATLQLLST